jgi:hypothetical protein
MREHKFRAWDPQFNRWLLPEDITICGDGTVYVDRRGENGGDVIDTVQPPKVVLESFTGLKDKDGREIYEGDFCRFFSGSIREIIFNNGGFGYISSGDFVGLAGHHHFDEIIIFLEVVGNIYDTPELLNG